MSQPALSETDQYVRTMALGHFRSWLSCGSENRDRFVRELWSIATSGIDDTDRKGCRLALRYINRPGMHDKS